LLQCSVPTKNAMLRLIIKLYYMINKTLLRLVIPALLIVPVLSFGQIYKSPSQVNDWLNGTQKANASFSKLHNLATSPGKSEVLMLEIGPEVSSQTKNVPAILVGANFEGDRPLTTEGAIFLISEIISDEALRKDHTWYIIPSGNPDASGAYLRKPLFENTRNDQPRNDDLDEQTDEDAPNDLNGDGFITKMRVKHPEGTWMPVAAEPRLMRKADAKDGEQGIYKLYGEGLDDDGDGSYDEDGKGGTNVNINFPHQFKYFNPESGLYPGSTPETFELIKFAYEHPEIAMVFAFGKTNFCHTPPQGGRRGEADMSSIKVPERYARMFGADPDKTYAMAEIIEMVQAVVPAGMTVDESMVASFLGLGAAVNPQADDLVFYKKFSEDYKKYLEDKGLKGERFKPEKAKDGSFELWSYYHLGLPVFSMDLWSVPKPEKKKEEGGGISLDDVEKMSTEDFLALGEEKINAFLKEQEAPEQFTAERIIQGMEGGQMDPARMAAMMKQMPKQETDEKGADPVEQAILDFSDKELDGKGFVDWQEFNHPTLGTVEIGGFVPFTSSTPPYSIVDSILGLKVPWIFELVKELPELTIHETKVTAEGGGVYQLELWVENSALIPFPTSMGNRNKQPAPAIVSISGSDITILSGLPRTPVQEVKGKERKKLSWLIKTEKAVNLQIKLESKNAGNDQETVKIGG